MSLLVMLINGGLEHKFKIHQEAS